MNNLVNSEEVEQKIQRMERLINKLFEAIVKFEEEANERVIKKREEIETEIEEFDNNCSIILGKKKENVIEEIAEASFLEVVENGLFQDIEDWKGILQDKLKDLKNGYYNEDVLLRDISQIDVKKGMEKLQVLEQSFEEIKNIFNLQHTDYNSSQSEGNKPNRNFIKEPEIIKEKEARDEIKFHEESSHQSTNIKNRLNNEKVAKTENKENFSIIKDEKSQAIFIFSKERNPGIPDAQILINLLDYDITNLVGVNCLKIKLNSSKCLRQHMKSLAYIITNSLDVTNIELDLSQAEISDKAFSDLTLSISKVAESISSFTLNLKQTSAHDKFIHDFVRNALSSMTSLKRLCLNLSRTPVTDKSLVDIFRNGITKIHTIETLILNFSQ